MKFLNLKSDRSNFRHSAFAIVRFATILIALSGLLELGAAASSRVFGIQSSELLFPSNSPFRPMTVDLRVLGPERPILAIDRLMTAAEKMASYTSVPYVFGGGRIGTPRQCQECIDCAQKLQLPANSSYARFNNCPSCRRCGIDCSNFVNRLFAEAGLKYRFADTRTLNASGEEFLQEQYGFINMGRDLLDARPGDLILEKGHVMMVISIEPFLGTIDYIHASRSSGSRKRMGGIELRRGMSLNDVQRDVIRILRHRELVLPDDSDIILGSNQSSVRYLLSSVRNLFATNE